MTNIGRAAPPAFLSAEEAAKYLSIKPHTLSVWRSTGRQKLPYVRIGGAVRYRLDDLERFVAENTRCPA